MNFERQFLDAIILSRWPGVGARRFAELIKIHGSPSSALKHADLPDPSVIKTKKQPMQEAEVIVKDYLEKGGLGTYLGAADYPRLLAAIPEPPPYLFRRGMLWPIDSFTVAIVGAREATARGVTFARKLARGLSELGVTIVSGGALGIDFAAHHGALVASGRTVLVTATGIDGCYPPCHESLFREVAERGGILTELLPGTPPRRDFFPTRNRIIAGLSQALVVVEGKKQSGSASSVVHMQKLKRPVFVWTGPHPAQFELREQIIQHGGLPLKDADPEFILSKILG